MAQILASVTRRECLVTDGTVLLLDLNAIEEVLSLLLVVQI